MAKDVLNSYIIFSNLLNNIIIKLREQRMTARTIQEKMININPKNK